MHGDNHPDKRALTDLRERTVARLAEAFARDELGLEAFEERVNDAFTCGSPSELEALVRDLGGVTAESGAVTTLARRTPDAQALSHGKEAQSTAIVRAPAARAVRAILGNVERRGALSVTDGMRFVAVLGNLELDLRETMLPDFVTEIHVRAVMGNIEIVVPADVSVECDGTGFLGNFECTARSLPDASAPRLRIVGSAVLGSIEVHARPPARVELLVREIKQLHSKG